MKSRQSRWIIGLVFGLLLAQTGWGFYNPQTGRWLSRDPIGERGGRNVYVIVGNDPIDRADPLGLQIWTGTTIDQAINTCLAGPNAAACLAELLADADLTAAQRAVINALIQKAKRIAACEAIYAAYKAAGKEGEGCNPGLTCEEYKKKVAAISAEVAGRSAWLGRKCDYVCPGSVGRGSKKAEKGHTTELAEKTVYLGKCIALMKAACGEK